MQVVGRQIYGVMFVCCFCLFTTVSGQPVEVAVNNNGQDQKKIALKTQEADVAAFLTRAAETRLMAEEEGKLAEQKGSTARIRDYGRLMVREQASLLNQIRKIAVSRKIAMPVRVSADSEDGRELLGAKSGSEFDEEFIRLMIFDHKRDIKEFRKALEYSDPVINAFAKKNLVLLEDHLRKIEAIREMQ